MALKKSQRSLKSWTAQKMENKIWQAIWKNWREILTREQ